MWHQKNETVSPFAEYTQTLNARYIYTYIWLIFYGKSRDK